MRMRLRHITLCVLHAVPLFALAQEEGAAWSIALDSVTVMGKRYASPVRQHADGTIAWDLRRMDDMPKLLGNSDPIHFTQMLPGIQTNNDFRSSVNIQGSDHSHSMVSISGVPVYQISHLLGFFSVFNGSHFPEMSIQKNQSTAAFPNRMGGQLTFELPETAAETVSGELSVGLISSQGTIRLPLGKKVSLNMSLRGSYINMLYGKWMKADEQTIKYSFYDVNATLLYRIDSGNSLVFDFYHGNDFASFHQEGDGTGMNDKWGNTVGAVHWLFHRPGGLQGKGSLFVTSYHNRFHYSMPAVDMEMPSAITDFGMKGCVTWKRWTAGADLTLHHIDPQRFETEHGAFRYPRPAYENAFEGSLYGNYSQPLGKNIIAAFGVRGTLYRSGNATRGSIDPNLSVGFQKGNTQVTASYALRHQYLFQTGFSNMGLPTEAWMSSSEHRPPQYGHLFSVTASQLFGGNRYRLTADIFYKKLYHQAEYSGSVLDFVAAENDMDRMMAFGKGENYGFSIMLNKCYGKLTGWMSYSYTQANRQFDTLGQGTFPASHERPHEVNAVATYAIGKHWSVGTVFVYASGTPFTAPAYLGLFNKNVLIQYGPHNGSRLKPYMRLDLSVNFKWKGRLLKENGINVSLYNATGRSNELFYYISTKSDGSFAYKPVKFVLNMLPSISYFCKF